MWSELPYEKWKDTLETLHMWMQIVGKVKLELAPFINEWWEVAFYITATGMTTGQIPFDDKTFEVDFDFFNHVLSICTSSGKMKTILLIPRTVSAFYEEFMGALKALGIQVSIWHIPVEVMHLIPFDKDTKHASYDGEYVRRWWQVLVQANMVFEKFRSSFHGKSSPVHFFWGSFDLNTARYSGKKAQPPQMEGTMGKIMRFAEDEENFSAGFWPGDERYPHPAFYSYMYPKPKGIEHIKLHMGAAFNEKLGECILPYDVIRNTKNPGKELLQFLETSYQEGAKLAGWNIQAFQTEAPKFL